MKNSGELYLSAREAAAELAISPATLYAYVSRGLVRAKADEDDPRRSLYAAGDIRKLKGRRRGARRPRQRRRWASSRHGCSRRSATASSTSATTA